MLVATVYLNHENFTPNKWHLGHFKCLFVFLIYLISYYSVYQLLSGTPWNISFPNSCRFLYPRASISEKCFWFLPWDRQYIFTSKKSCFPHWSAGQLSAWLACHQSWHPSSTLLHQDSSTSMRLQEDIHSQNHGQIQCCTVQCSHAIQSSTMQGR